MSTFPSPRQATDRLTASRSESDGTGYVIVTAADGMTYAEGRARGLSIVVPGDWCVSTITGQGPHGTMIRLNVRQFDAEGKTVPHAALDGMLFGNTEGGRDAAAQLAYEAGVTGFFAYFRPAVSA